MAVVATESGNGHATHIVAGPSAAGHAAHIVAGPSAAGHATHIVPGPSATGHAAHIVAGPSATSHSHPQEPRGATTIAPATPSEDDRVVPVPENPVLRVSLDRA